MGTQTWTLIVLRDSKLGCPCLYFKQNHFHSPLSAKRSSLSSKSKSLSPSWLFSSSSSRSSWVSWLLTLLFSSLKPKLFSELAWCSLHTRPSGMRANSSPWTSCLSQATHRKQFKWKILFLARITKSLAPKDRPHFSHLVPKSLYGRGEKGMVKRAEDDE